MWCNVCGSAGPFVDGEGGREGSVCPNCSAPARTRALLYVLGAWLGASGPVVEWPAQKQVNAMEASGRGAYPMFLAAKLCDVNAGFESNDDRKHSPLAAVADLRCLAYRDGDLDLVLAADVFEHVPDDERGFREVWRVLNHGGALLFTVPYMPEQETLVRVSVVDGKEQFLEPPEYHGGGGRGLAYRTYGRDLPARLQAVGFTVGYWQVSMPDHGLFGQDVFLCVKAAGFDLGRLMRSRRVAPAAELSLLPLRFWVGLKYNLRAARQVLRELRVRLAR